jgi:hypothetical protein
MIYGGNGGEDFCLREIGRRLKTGIYFADTSFAAI